MKTSTGALICNFLATGGSGLKRDCGLINTFSIISVTPQQRRACNMPFWPVLCGSSCFSLFIGILIWMELLLENLLRHLHFFFNVPVAGAGGGTVFAKLLTKVDQSAHNFVWGQHYWLWYSASCTAYSMLSWSCSNIGWLYVVVMGSIKLPERRERQDKMPVILSIFRENSSWSFLPFQCHHGMLLQPDGAKKSPHLSNCCFDCRGHLSCGPL